MDKLMTWSSQELKRMRSALDRLFDDMCADMGLPPVSMCGPGGICIREKEDEIVLTAPLAGGDLDNVELVVSETMVSLKTKTTDPGMTRTTAHRVRLPALVDPDHARARTQNGMLLLTMPKKKTNRPTVRIAID